MEYKYEKNKNKNKKIIIILIIINLFSALPTISADNYIKTIMCQSSQILYVGGSGPNNYSRIQDAINNATDGDMVYVYCGFYYEHIQINKEINLIGENKEQTIIIGDKTDNIIRVQTGNFKITGFTIKKWSDRNLYSLFIKFYIKTKLDFIQLGMNWNIEFIIWYNLS